MIDTSILYTPEWFDFDNIFEEGWGGNPDCKCLANVHHHKEVAALAATNLSKIYPSMDNIPDALAQEYYDAAAKELYPDEKLWTGDNEDNPVFWREYINSTDWPKSYKERFWYKILNFTEPL